MDDVERKVRAIWQKLDRLDDAFCSLPTESLFGDDLFISYSRADGADYATALRVLARHGFSCRFDQWVSDPGKKVPDELLRPLDGAASSSWSQRAPQDMRPPCSGRSATPDRFTLIINGAGAHISYAFDALRRRTARLP